MILKETELMNVLKACGVPVDSGTMNLVTELHPAAERAVKDFVGYEIELNNSYVQYLPDKSINLASEIDSASAGFALQGSYVVPIGNTGVSGREIVLAQLPVRSITSIYEGYYPPTSLVTPDSYILDTEVVSGYSWSGIVHRRFGAWTRDRQSIMVTYSAGLGTDEIRQKYPFFRRAVIETLLAAVGDVKIKGRYAAIGGFPNSLSIEDFSVTLSNPMTAGGLLGVGAGAASLPTSVQTYLQPYRHPAAFI